MEDVYIHPWDVKSDFKLAMGQIPQNREESPLEEIVRGKCPECGSLLVANMYWHEVKGYLLRYECWESMMPEPTCEFYAVP